ncbi:hypothetical protein [Bosea sp. LjRoot237]|uniref:hypothetical protein n=1 Tax=Bosea sp. LjRoot237 TaxID=3342292 RepID=UPI003ECCE069
MNRRSFVLSLFGGFAAASVGGMGIAQAAVPAPAAEDLAPALKAGLDKADADFSQTVVRRTTVVRRPAYRRPVVVRRTTVVRRPTPYRRPVVVRRTTVVRRPAPYRRPVVVRRRVIYR